MNTKTLELALDFPVTDKPKRRVNDNVFQEVLLERMNELRITDAVVVKATGVKASTWQDWIVGKIKHPIIDERLIKVLKFLNIEPEEIVYGLKKKAI